jgi:hypothetical protein
LSVSPVKLSATQDGAFLVPSSTRVLTTIVDPLLKLALVQSFGADGLPGFLVDRKLVHEL